MKIPAKNVIILLLAVVAVGMVFWQTFHPHRTHPSTPVAAGLSPAPLAGTPAKPAPEDAQTRFSHIPEIDRLFTESHFTEWLAATQRDPFLQLKPVVAAAPTNQVTKLNSLTLKGVWRQSGVSMAAINHGIYRLGEVIEGHKLVGIEDNQVWLEHDGKKEPLGFVVISSTNAPKSALAKPKHAASAPKHAADTPKGNADTTDTEADLSDTNALENAAATPETTAAALESVAAALKKAAAALKPTATETN